MESFEKQLEYLKIGADEIVPEDEFCSVLKKSIETNVPLRVKLGIDPTNVDIHIGHVVTFRKLRHFQDMGHTAVVIIGDYTASIGDPTGKDAQRPPLTLEQTRKNAETYLEQISKVVDKDRLEVHFQTEWFDKLGLGDVLRLAGHFSVAQLLAHDTFRKRLDEGKRLSLHEMFYPILQAYDSVMINSDVELGGTDQKFNILCGRELMRDNGKKPQTALLLPLLMGTNGLKMSKSENNYIALNDLPREKFGKVMSISDDLIYNYFLYASDYSPAQLQEITKRIESGENPRNLKIELAGNIVKIYHGEKSAEEEKNFFIETFSKKKLPDDIPLFNVSDKGWIVQVIADTGFVSSNSEARRLIKSRSVSINGEKVEDENLLLDSNTMENAVLQVGKKRFVKLVFNETK